MPDGWISIRKAYYVRSVQLNVVIPRGLAYWSYFLCHNQSQLCAEIIDECRTQFLSLNMFMFVGTKLLYDSNSLESMSMSNTKR